MFTVVFSEEDYQSLILENIPFLFSCCLQLEIVTVHYLKLYVECLEPRWHDIPIGWTIYIDIFMVYKSVAQIAGIIRFPGSVIWI